MFSGGNLQLLQACCSQLLESIAASEQLDFAVMFCILDNELASKRKPER
jgi:hypothetical protein